MITHIDKMGDAANGFNVDFMSLSSKIIVIAFLLGSSYESLAQSVFLELGGPAGLYSLNYDTRFNKSAEGNGMGIRVGMESVGDGFALPVQLNYLIGSGGKYLDLAAGFTFVTGGGLDFGDGIGVVTATIKYRYQPVNGGFTWSAGLTAAPNIIDFPVIPSVAAGFAF